MKIRNIFMWLYMLNKRLYKRPSFLIMLAAVIVITAALSMYARQDSNVLNIAIYATGDTVDYLEEYTKTDSIIGYVYYQSKEDAVNAVTNSGFDAAWIFSDDIAVSAKQFVEKGEPVVRVVQREDTIFLKIAREKLFAVLYPKLSRALYLNYVEKNFNAKDNNMLNRLYNNELTDNEIVEIKYNDSSLDTDNLNHLISPLRGLLAVAMFLCAYAALLNFKKDRNSGLFARIPADKHIYVEIASILVAVINQAVVMLIAIIMCGLFTSWQVEIVYLIVYVFLCTAFCVIIGEFFDNINALSAIMPIISMIMIVLCPIFINTQKLKLIQILLPPYYYLSAFRNVSFVMLSIVYIVITCGVYALTRFVKRRI